MEAVRYLNPWAKKLGTAAYFERKGAPLLSYRGFDIYEWSEFGYPGFDYVYDGVCITQRAGVSKYKQVIDELLDSKEGSALHELGETCAQVLASVGKTMAAEGVKS
jgi:hypothetical protein